MLRAFPWVNPEIAVGATICPSDGFLLPHVVYNEGAGLAEEGGVRVLKNAPVVGANHENGKLIPVETPEGDLFSTAPTPGAPV